MNKTINEQSTDKSIESIEFKIIYNKKKIDITFSLDRTIAELKDHLESIISVPKEMQKVMIKGLAKDQDTLRSLGLANGKYRSLFFVFSSFSICVRPRFNVHQHLYNELFFIF